MKTDVATVPQPTGRSFRTATIVGVVILLFTGGGFRALASYYSRPSTSVPIPKGTLAKLPLIIGEWSGQDIPLDVEIVRRTDTDDLINRRYQRAGGSQAVSLYVAYGVRLRDLSPHRPEVCYPGAGWTLDENKSMELKGADGSQVPCRLLRFHKGALISDKILVLSYYIIDGQYYPDVSLLRSKAWRAYTAGSYSAQVQFMCPDSTEYEAEKYARDLAARSSPLILRLLADAVAAANPAPASRPAVRD
jgi:EpsI family protein